MTSRAVRSDPATAADSVVVAFPTVSPKDEHRAARTAPSVTRKTREIVSDNNVLSLPVSPIIPRESSSISPQVTRANRSGLKPHDAQISLAELPAYTKGKSNQFLKRSFPKAWNEHQTLLAKHKKKRQITSILHPTFKTFRGFLLCMGPAPSPGHSINCLDVARPIYGPGTCEWATARRQANYRSTNVNIPINGETRTLADWARFFGLSYAAVKKRHARQWPVERLFESATRNKSKLPSTRDEADCATAHSGAAALLRPSPPVRMTVEGWPEGLYAPTYETGYIHALTTLQKRYPTDRTIERWFTRVYFAAWILGSRRIAAGKHIGAQHPHLFFRDQVANEDLRELDARAEQDPIVCSWHAEGPQLTCAMDALVSESFASNDKYADPSRRAEAVIQGMRGLWKTNPCISATEAWLLLKEREPKSNATSK